MKQFIAKCIQDNPRIESEFGEIKIGEQLGEGGNGIVRVGTLCGRDVAVKFLASSDKKKLARFKQEYLFTKMLPSTSYLAKNIHFQSTQMDGRKVYFIVMEKYDSRLKRPTDEEVTEENVKKLAKFLLNSLEFIHQYGIIHRDIKPENILVKDGEYFLADFGIAHFSEEEFKKFVKTKNSDRMANFKFSAPEQSEEKYEPIPASDLYSMGQVIQWYVTGKVHKGTHRESFRHVEGLERLNEVVNALLMNDPAKRPENIDAVVQLIDKIKERTSKRDFRPILQAYSDAIAPLMINQYKQTVFVDNESDIELFLNELSSANLSDHDLDLLFETGDLPSELYKSKDGKWILYNFEIDVESMYVHCSSFAPDYNLVILNIKKGEPFSDEIVHSGYAFEAAYSESMGYISSSELDFGWVERDGVKSKLDKSDVTYRERFDKQQSVILASFFHGITMKEMDEKREELLKAINFDGSSVELVHKFVKEKLWRHVRDEVSMWR